MHELMQHLIAFKYACKLNHWHATDYATHIQCDRLSEMIDTWTDRIAECYFMASDNSKILQSNILNPKLINSDLAKMCKDIIQHLEELQSDDDLNAGLASMLSNIEEEMLNKLSLAKLS